MLVFGLSIPHGGAAMVWLQVAVFQALITALLAPLSNKAWHDGAPS